jgi:peptidoglycan/LPS O-acetylase OafA/YrhL
MQTVASPREDSRAKIDWLKELDGWRGVSILLVLAGHLLPLGPSEYDMNAAVAAAGMGLFFILSGFLITSFLLHESRVRVFLIRRGARILPLAWVYMALVMALNPQVSGEAMARQFLFVANLPPFGLFKTTTHLWSLCLEVQFYVLTALVVAVSGRKGLLLAPLAAVAVTMYRAYTGTHISIITWLRIDEILAGSSLALLYSSGLLRKLPSKRASTWMVVVAILYFVSCHSIGGPLNYLRPYLAATLVGLSICAANGELGLLKSKHLRYIATISYALYVLHPFLAATWLGAGTGLEKYAKRPLLFLCLWALAHLSTRYFEGAWTAWARRITDAQRTGRLARGPTLRGR